MANSSRKGKKKVIVDEPSRDSRSDDPIDNSPSDPDMKAFSLSGSNVDNIISQSNFDFLCLIQMVR